MITHHLLSTKLWAKPITADLGTLQVILFIDIFVDATDRGDSNSQ